MTRIAVFGDVHGHLPVLRALHKRVNDQYNIDQWYSCGDLGDRGPDTPGVIQFCIDNNVEAVLGNHDEWLLHAIRHGMREQFFLRTWFYHSNGGKQTVEQYGGEITQVINSKGGLNYLVEGFKVPPSHEEYLYHRPTVIETDYGYVLHGGIGSKHVKAASNRIQLGLIRKGHEKITREEAIKLVTPFDCDEDNIRWFHPGGQGADYEGHYWCFDKPQIVGHIGVQKPLIGESRIALDTGCACPDGSLTAIVLPEREFVTVTKEEIYGAFPPD